MGTDWLGQEDNLTCSVFRSFDNSTWMCNVPLVAVAQGVQASRSLTRIKRYVEEVAAQQFQGTDGGTWVREDEDSWAFHPRDAE